MVVQASPLNDARDARIAELESQLAISLARQQKESLIEDKGLDIA